MELMHPLLAYLFVFLPWEDLLGFSLHCCHRLVSPPLEGRGMEVKGLLVGPCALFKQQ